MRPSVSAASGSLSEIQAHLSTADLCMGPKGRADCIRTPEARLTADYCIRTPEAGLTASHCMGLRRQN